MRKLIPVLMRALSVLCLSLSWLPQAAIAGPKSPPPPRTSSCALALSPDGSTLLAVNHESGSLSLIDTASLELRWELPVGPEPITLALSADGNRALTANRGNDTVSIVDLSQPAVLGTIGVDRAPWGVLFSPSDSSTAYIACETASTVDVLDLGRLFVKARIESSRRPAGLAITADGRKLLISNIADGSLDIVDIASLQIAGRISSFSGAELSPSIILSSDGSRAYLPQTRSNEGNTSLSFDTTLFPLVVVVDPERGQQLKGETIFLAEVDEPVAIPYDAALSGDGKLLVLNSASDDLSVIELESGLAEAHVDVGANPRGVVLSSDGARAFVLNSLDGTISVIDTSTWSVMKTVRTSTIPLPPVLLEGKKLFFSSAAPKLSRENWISCNSCHWEGGMDGRTWNFSFAGPRNTTSLEGMIGTYPLRWSASWDESADSESAIRLEQFGDGLIDGQMNPTGESPNQGRSLQLDSLAAYLDSLSAPRSPAPRHEDASQIERGRRIFFDQTTGCSSCHPPPRYTDFKTHDVGTADGPMEVLGPEIDTPSLLNLGETAPYLHDGSAADLEAVPGERNASDRHGNTSQLDPDDIQALLSFLRYGLSAPGHAARRAEGRAGDQAVKMIASHPKGGNELSGIVVWADTGAPASHALVSIRAAENTVTADPEGTFSIQTPETSVELAAWAPGAYIASEKVDAPASGLSLSLRRLHTGDNTDYEWVDPDPAVSGSSACGSCHPQMVQRWSGNAHGSAISNPRFFSFYKGTDISGEHTVEPGYLLDFPGTAGSCAACHAPGAAVDAAFTTNMNDVRGETTAGIHCDFCHKTLSAYLQPFNSDPYSNMPGVFSLKTLRPPSGDNVFFGPYPDIHDTDTYAPQMRDSRFCAPCHQHSFWGTPIYTSYSEWKASSYASRGIDCQDCHMPPSGDTHFALPSAGGLEHPAESIPSHLQLGVADADFISTAADLVVSVDREPGVLHLSVKVRNIGAGHDLPTDHPGRHLLLSVEVEDSSGSALPLAEGPRLPAWAGSLAGLPGTVYAKILSDVATGEKPVVSYWKPTLIESDNRISAGGESNTHYDFVWNGEAATIRVRLRFRRLFEPIARRYGWDRGEILLKEFSDETN